MGLGDNLMATGMARGARARGKRIAFGNGSNIIWDTNSEEIFRNNPNIAPPGSEGASDLEWIHYYKTSRIYNKHDHANDRWIWNYDFRPKPGEMFFHRQELDFGKRIARNFVVIEPHVPYYKGSAPNKTWPVERYEAIVDMLKQKDYQVVQFRHNGQQIKGVIPVHAPSFRHALAGLKHAKAFVGPEGGMHHGAAAVGTPAVVIFGSFIPPQVTGYDNHINLTGGADRFCGSLSACSHCRDTLLSIKTKHVWDGLKRILECSTSSVGSGETSGQESSQKNFSQVSGAI